MTDYLSLALLDQREVALSRAIRTVSAIYNGMSDGPDKIAVQITIRVLEAELETIKEKAEAMLSA